MTEPFRQSKVQFLAPGGAAGEFEAAAIARKVQDVRPKGADESGLGEARVRKRRVDGVANGFGWESRRRRKSGHG